jgi:hypothetical protein
MFENIFSDGELSNFIKLKTNDTWKNTPFEGYTFLHNASKGSFGEKFVQKYMEQNGCIVKKKTSAGHDRIIDGYKTEIKFSLGGNNIKKDNLFYINHLSVEKDNNRVIFFGIHKDIEKCLFVWWDSLDFNNYVKNGPGIFYFQQGGNKLSNDDYMFVGTPEELLILPFIKNIKEWRE